MEERKNNLVFFAMGEMYNKQCLYAILSLLNVYERKIPNSIHIYVYTNLPKLYDVLEHEIPLDLICIDENTMQRWRMGKSYFFTTKISLIREFLMNYPGNMVFVDTDVIFKKKLNAVFDKVSRGEYILHLKESQLSLPENTHFMESFQDKKFTLQSGRIIHVNGSSEMWNSGLIGISSSDVDLVEDVLELCGKLEPHSTSRVLEQLAFSLIFKNTGRLVGERSLLVHYWWKKSLFNPIINEALEDTKVDLDKLLNKVATLDPTNRTMALRFFYSLHPNGLLRKSIVKTSLILGIPIK